MAIFSMLGGAKLRSRVPTAPPFTVKVPPNGCAGQMMQVQAPNGATVQVQIPPGSVAGSRIQVAVPVPAGGPGPGREVGHEDLRGAPLAPRGLRGDGLVTLQKRNVSGSEFLFLHVTKRSFSRCASLRPSW